MEKNCNAESGCYESKTEVMWELAFGERAHQFDALLETIPTMDGLNFLSERLKRADISSVIMALDGTLASAFAEVSADVRSKLADLIQSGVSVVVFPDTSFSMRCENLRKEGVVFPRQRKTNASTEAFNAVCDECSLDPSKTAIIGSSAFTDIPNTSGINGASFPLKILVNPIKPVRELMEPIGGFGEDGLVEPVEGFFARKLVEAKYKYNAARTALRERARYRKALRDYEDALMCIDVISRNKPHIIRNTDRIGR